MYMSKPLDRELKTLERERERLEREHMGKYVLIREDAVTGTYDDFQTASDEGLRQFGNSLFLIRKIGEDTVNLAPSIVLGLTSGDIQSELCITSRISRP